MTIKNISPFDEAELQINDLFNEAKVWLDGGKVETAEQDEVVKKLLDLAKSAKKQANTARVDEKRPHDEAGKAVQVKFGPMLTLVEAIIDGCKGTRQSYLLEQDRLKREAELKAREDADEAERLAQQAMQQTNVSDVEQRLEAEKLVERAKEADKQAKRAAKPTATGLRTSYKANLTDLSMAIKHYWISNPNAFRDLVIDLARKDVLAGKREIHGFEIKEIKEAI